MSTEDWEPRDRKPGPTCPEHGGPTPCPACAPTPPPEGIFDQIRADLDAAKTTHTQRDAKERARAERKQ